MAEENSKIILLDVFNDRRVRAETMSEEFRTHPAAFEKLKKILKAETFLRGLQIALKAPRTMNPQKIKDHYNMVRDYIKEFGDVIIPEDSVFMEQLVIKDVHSYDQFLTKWATFYLKNKMAELLDLAKS